MDHLEREKGFYEKHVKRLLGFSCALLGLIVLCPIFLCIAILVRTNIGTPVLFKQRRPGHNEEIFTLYKFRTMTDQKDKNGDMMPDDIRLTRFGEILRTTSLDELPQLFNILRGDMSLVGPRPHLVKDMVFMSRDHRKRHSAKVGLTGLAQVNGRNDLTWEEKLDIDIEYINNVTFRNDLKIFLLTPVIVFRREGIQMEGSSTVVYYGDYLYKKGKISYSEYREKIRVADGIIDIEPPHESSMNSKRQTQSNDAALSGAHITGGNDFKPHYNMKTSSQHKGELIE